MTDRAADDYKEIEKRRRIVAAYGRHECFRHHGFPQEQCWCWYSGPGGHHLPCPTVHPEKNQPLSEASVG